MYRQQLTLKIQYTVLLHGVKQWDQCEALEVPEVHDPIFQHPKKYPLIMSKAVPVIHILTSHDIARLSEDLMALLNSDFFLDEFVLR